MTHLLLTVMGQAKYVCAVHKFIQDLLLKTAPEFLKGSGAIKTEEEFKDTIDAAIASVTTSNATERDYVRAMVETASAEMKPFCHLLRGAADVVGLRKIAERYLDGARFQEMLLRRDQDKLERLNDILRKASVGPVNPAKILMDVAKVLDENAESYDDLDAAAKRKAQRDIARLMGKVEEIHNEMNANKDELAHLVAEGKDELAHRIAEGKDEIVSHVDAVGAKIDKLKIKGKRKSKYEPEQKKVCLSCWMAAQENEELKSGTRTGDATYEAAFNWYKRQLALVGVTKLDKFIKIIRSIRVKKCTDQKAALDAKREAERKAKNKPGSRARKR